MKLTSQRLILSEVSWEDLENIHQLHSFPEVDEFNTLGIPANIGETEIFMQNIIDLQKIKPQKSYTWTVKLQENNEFVGLAGFTLSLDKFKRGEIYYKILPIHWGLGYATEVAKLLIKTGFDSFNLHRIEAGVAIRNAASIKVLEKAGMNREGQHKKILPIRGEWVDNYHYAIVENDIKVF